ncbi:ATPase AAA [Chitinispirillum alkaliphilum]|nr:ATPase AAA [Chitinispirillum alkaliphilum]
MTEQEILELLNQHEWKDVEFKEARTAIPKSAYESVSAFANTEGGHLVFGVKKDGSDFEVVGVIDVDKIQNDFLTSLRQKEKINQPVDVQENLHTIESKDLLVFYIPESSRTQKPVYLNGTITRSYLRKGACDVKCTQDEIHRLLRDASTERYDSEALSDFSADNFYDEGSVRWYRNIFNQKHPGRHETLSDADFLLEWGFLKEISGKTTPTRAAVLFFGKARYVRQVVPRAIVDYQRINTRFEEWIPEKRWDDREVFEENLIQTWLGLLEKYSRISEKPFSVDGSTMRRGDNPPDYITFRESAINLLMHQDYGDHTRMPVVQFFVDRTIFKNPGDAFATKEELLEPGTKEVRNPAIVNAFRRIGLSDQAGTGIRSIFQSWADLGNVPPEVNNDKSEKTFELILAKEKLLSEEQVLFQSSIGVHLSEVNAKVFAYACQTGKTSLTDIKAVTNATSKQCKEIADHLVVQVLLKWVDQSNLAVVDHLWEKFVGSQNTESEPTETSAPAEAISIDEISDGQRDTIAFCTVPKSMTEIQNKFGFSNRTYFKRKALDPLIVLGLVRMTNPENPKASNQKYVISEHGFRLLKIWEESSD